MSDYTQDGVYEDKPPLARNYGDRFVVFDHGKGVWMWDRAGNKYLDFGSGIAVNSFGHGRADFARIVARQTRRVVHVSNLYMTQETIDIAKRLTSSSPKAADQPVKPGVSPGYFKSVHLGNSGTEANEAAMKYARIFAKRRAIAAGKEPASAPTKILAFENAFHGRTMGALSVTYSKVYREICEPLVPGAVFIPYNDLEALKKTLDDSFCAVIVEPIQGEGGLTPMTAAFAAELNSLCRKLNVVLIADEIQTGLGRTGKLFGSELVGLEPDIITLAKPLAGGLPFSATLLVPKVADVVQPGDHGTTFGGGPVASKLAAYVWDMVNADGFLDIVNAKAALFQTRLELLKKEFPWLGELRGAGLLRGVEILASKAIAGRVGVEEGKPVESSVMPSLVEVLRREGLIVLRSGKNVLRLAPPLIMNDKEILEGFTRLRRGLAKFGNAELP